MKIGQLMGIAAILGSAGMAMAASAPNIPGVQTQMVITALPARNGAPPATLGPGDVAVQEGKVSAPVVHMERLAGDLANMQLFVLLDDSTRSVGLGQHFNELKKFLQSLPVTTEVAVGYMRFGTFVPAQTFTTDHQKAANSLRLPDSVPGENGNPYFAVSELAKHWPSKEATNRRAVLMFSDGIDRYWGSGVSDDPYEDSAIKDSLKNGIMIYTIYLRGAGVYDRLGWPKLMGQSHLTEIAEETGGFAYFEALSDPVDLTPFLKDFENRLDNQYRVTISANEKGVQPVKLRTELPGVKVSGPTRIYVP